MTVRGGHPGAARGSRPGWLLGLFGLALVVIAVVLAPRGWEQYHLRSLQAMPGISLQKYVATHKEDLDAAYLMGMQKVRAGKLREGSDQLLAVFQKDPTRVHVLNDYAVALMAQQRYTEALTALTGMLKVDPNYAPAWANLGRLHILNDMPFTAATELERATKLNPNSVEAFRDLGTAQQQSMNYRAALHAFGAARRLDPDDASAGVGLAQVNEALTRPDEAAKVIEDVAKRHPDNVDAEATLGEIRLQRAVTHPEIEASLQPLQTAAALSQDNVPVLFNLGVALRRLGRNEDAIASFRRALAIEPDSPAALYQLSQVLLAAGQPAEGQRLSEQFRVASAREKLQSGLEGRINQNANDNDARLQLAELYLAERQYVKAALQCSLLLSAQPHRKDVRRLLVRTALAAQYSPSAPAWNISTGRNVPGSQPRAS